MSLQLKIEFISIRVKGESSMHYNDLRKDFLYTAILWILFFGICLYSLCLVCPDTSSPFNFLASLFPHTFKIKGQMILGVCCTIKYTHQIYSVWEMWLSQRSYFENILTINLATAQWKTAQSDVYIWFVILFELPKLKKIRNCATGSTHHLLTTILTQIPVLHTVLTSVFVACTV